MKYRWIVLLWAFFQCAYANVAVDELNALLAKKESGAAASAPTKEQTNMIKNIRENYYFVFIYKGSCPHCHNFAPVLDDFASTFHFKVNSYSLDNQALAPFQGTPLTPELFNTFFIIGGYKPQVPALFLVNRHTLDAYAVLFGETKPYVLANRVKELMEHIEEKYHD
jgi:type-F conjugative transfer system pilin assembly thiol-disulfide isomerase TrbB